jgi:hypothetical protein
MKKLSIGTLEVSVFVGFIFTSLSFVSDNSLIDTGTEAKTVNDSDLTLTDCFKLEFNLAGDLELIPTCTSGGVGSTSCSEGESGGDCSVSLTEPGEA